MSPAARTLQVFGVYVVVVGITMLVVPNVVLSVLGVPTTTEPWIHLAGYLAVVIGVYYLVAAYSEALALARASVPVRLASGVVFVVLAAIWAYWPVALFAVPDLAGAAWTRTALRRPVPVPST